MHVQFIPYGTRTRIEEFFREIEAQKFEFPLHGPNGEHEKIWLYGAVRQLPFGIYEYVFPREYLDVILTTFNFHETPPYNLGRARLAVLRKLAKSKAAPKSFDKSKRLIWRFEGVSLIPIGIREDGDFLEKQGAKAGWTHEAI